MRCNDHGFNVVVVIVNMMMGVMNQEHNYMHEETFRSNFHFSIRITEHNRFVKIFNEQFNKKSTDLTNPLIDYRKPVLFV